MLWRTLFIVFAFSSTASANILGNMQTFSPTPDSLFFENVHSSKTLGKNHFNLGGYMAFVRNELSVYDNMTTQNYNKYKDSAMTFDFIAAWGVTDRFEVFYSLPMFINQKPDSGQYQDNKISRGINTHRPGIKYDVSHGKYGGLALIGSVDFPVTKNDPYTGTDANPIYNLEGVYDIRNSVSAYALNVGYRFRDPGNLPTNAYFFPLNDQIIYSLGYVTALNTNHRFHAEIFGALSADKEPHREGKHVSALEGLLAYKQRLMKGLWGHVGATGEILPEGLAPQFRVYAGLNYFFSLNSKSSGNTPPASPAEPAPRLEELPPSEPLTTVQEEVAPALFADSTEVEMFEGEAKTISISGGQPPLRFKLSRPFGEFSESDRTYQAPPRPGSVDLITSDNAGSSVRVHINVKAIPKASQELVIDNLQFKYNSDELIASSQKILANNIAKLQGQKIKKIIVVGHTDDKGRDEYNLTLSRRRAQTVAQRLQTDLGLKKDQIQAIGRGETAPVATNKTEVGRQKNRRVELKLYY